MLWSHRIDITDPHAHADITALHRMARAPHPIEINVARTLPYDELGRPETTLLVALAVAAHQHGHVLHLVGAPGFVHEWWKAIHQAAGAEVDNRPELRLVDGGQP